MVKYKVCDRIRVIAIYVYKKNEKITRIFG